MTAHTHTLCEGLGTAGAGGHPEHGSQPGDSPRQVTADPGCTWGREGAQGDPSPLAMSQSWLACF